MNRLMALLMVAIGLTTGCTRNDGDIGVWFGTWVVESIIRDNTPLTDNDEVIVMIFQSSVLETKAINPLGDNYGRFATWHESDGVMIIDAASDATEIKGLYAGLQLPNVDGIRLEILEQTSKRAILQWYSPYGFKLTYKLRKHL
ncbi:MAG: hypothetical protein NC131_21845 [Roseburia sp.]|nr:hypothetical protein [Roseburia sp.]